MVTLALSKAASESVDFTLQANITGLGGEAWEKQQQYVVPSQGLFKLRKFICAQGVVQCAFAQC